MKIFLKIYFDHEPISRFAKIWVYPPRERRVVLLGDLYLNFTVAPYFRCAKFVIFFLIFLEL